MWTQMLKSWLMPSDTSQSVPAVPRMTTGFIKPPSFGPAKPPAKIVLKAEYGYGFDEPWTSVITAETFAAIFPNVHDDDVANYYTALITSAHVAGITTAFQMVMFLCQIHYESGGLTELEEDLYYSARGLISTFPTHFTSQQAIVYANKPQMIANHVYASRGGNGNEASGDGWRYHGRGAIQTTFKANYEEFFNSPFAYLPSALVPESLASAPMAMTSAMFYWQSRNIAKETDFSRITQLVQGSDVSVQQRLATLNNINNIILNKLNSSSLAAIGIA